MLVVNHHALHCFSGNINNVADSFKAFFNRIFAFRHFEIESQIFDTPFTTMSLVIILCVLLDCDIRQMDHHIVKLCNILCIFSCTESCKPARINPDFQGTVARH